MSNYLHYDVEMSMGNSYTITYDFSEDNIHHTLDKIKHRGPDASGEGGGATCATAAVHKNINNIKFFILSQFILCYKFCMFIVLKIIPIWGNNNYC